MDKKEELTAFDLEMVKVLVKPFMYDRLPYEEKMMADKLHRLGKLQTRMTNGTWHMAVNASVPLKFSDETPFRLAPGVVQTLEGQLNQKMKKSPYEDMDRADLIQLAKKQARIIAQLENDMSDANQRLSEHDIVAERNAEDIKARAGDMRTVLDAVGDMFYSLKPYFDCYP